MLRDAALIGFLSVLMLLAWLAYQSRIQEGFGRRYTQLQPVLRWMTTGCLLLAILYATGWWVGPAGPQIPDRVLALEALVTGLLILAADRWFRWR